MRAEDAAALAYTTTAADGTVVHLRPITPDDKAMLAAGFDRLSAESRFRRFFSAMTHLSAAQLAYFTEIDYVDHFAWVAYVDRPDGPLGVGVARYIRSHAEPCSAEAAVAVTDDHHRRGIGTILLEALAAVALSNGVTSFDLLVRPDNHAMIAAMNELGARSAPDDDPTSIKFVLDLPVLAAGLRSTPMWQVFRLAGAGAHDFESVRSR